MTNVAYKRKLKMRKTKTESNGKHARSRLDFVLTLNRMWYTKMLEVTKEQIRKNLIISELLKNLNKE